MTSDSIRFQNLLALPTYSDMLTKIDPSVFCFILILCIMRFPKAHDFWCSLFVDLGFWILNPRFGSWICVDLGFGILEFGIWILVFGFFEIWILDLGFLWVLDFGYWILDFGSLIFVDLGFGILIPSTTKGLESLALSMFLWCHRALAKSWERVGTFFVGYQGGFGMWWEIQWNAQKRTVFFFVNQKRVF